MACILYGVQGEGMGHALRSKPIIAHLIQKGHDVHILVGGRAYEFLRKMFDNVHEVAYMPIYYENNEVNYRKSYQDNIRRKDEWNASKKKVFSHVEKKKPDIIISDYELFSALASQRYHIPLISIDNIHMALIGDIAYPKKYVFGRMMAKLSTLMAFLFNGGRWKADHFFITTFFYPKQKNRKITLFPPIIREEVMSTRPKEGKHILVYQTSPTYTAMFPVLKRFQKEKFILYGFHVSKKDRNLTFKKNSKEGFLKDLASAKAVIMNGGFTLMTECLYLGKPVFSIPVKGQFEQVINAVYLEKLGYGKFEEELTEEHLKTFLENTDKYKKNIKRCAFDGNKKLFSALDRTITEATG